MKKNLRSAQVALALSLRIGKRIKSIRKAKGLTLRQLSEASAKFHPRHRRVSIAQISKIENGEPPHLLQLIPLAGVLGVRTQDILFARQITLVVKC